MQYPTETKLKFNLLSKFCETENYCYLTVFKTPNNEIDPVTFYKRRTTIQCNLGNSNFVGKHKTVRVSGIRVIGID